MYVYLRSEPSLYTVGFYKPDGNWEAESDHTDSEEAAARVNYLNVFRPRLSREEYDEIQNFNPLT